MPKKARSADLISAVKRLATQGDLVERGVEAATKIADVLSRTLEHDRQWVESDLAFEEQREGDHQHGYVTIFTIDDRLDFGIWLERTAAPDEADVPILCAAFGAHSSADGKALEAIAESEDVRSQRYDYGQRERLVGFGREPVLEVPSNVARFLSSYRPAGDFDVEGAVHQFRVFWEVWAHKVMPITKLPQRRRLRADWTSRALRGLVGELVVLARPDMAKSTWVGMATQAHDLERGRLLIEVKTRSGNTSTLSRQQIDLHASERYFIAVVELPLAAQLVLRGSGDGDSKLHPVIERHRTDIVTYLRRRGVELDAPLLAAISRAVRLSTDAVTFHRLVPPEGFEEALAALERFGRVADLAIDCGLEWFVPAKLPR